MARRSFLVVFTIAAAGAICWLSTSPGTAAPPVVSAKTPESNLPVDKEVVDAGNRFGIEVIKNLYAQSPDKNVFISPAGLNFALTMTMNGASGDTNKAISEVLGVQGMDSQRVNKAYSAMTANFAAPGPEVQISLANSLWLRKGIEFNPGFIYQNRSSFNARIGNLGYENPKAAAMEINSWVRKSTNGQVDRIIDRVEPDVAIVLANALHFSGTWVFDFDPKDTKTAAFTLKNGKQKQVRMMSRYAALFYVFRGSGFTAVRVPYRPLSTEYGRDNSRFGMYIFLPDKPDGLDSLLNWLTADKWNQSLSQFSEDVTELNLPRFQASCTADDEMRKALTDLGMGNAFDPAKADFQAMAAGSLCLSRVVHKSVLRVDEKGTEASSIFGGLGVSSKGDSVTVDHPFFWAIRDNKTGQLLFAGVIVDPEKL